MPNVSTLFHWRSILRWRCSLPPISQLSAQNENTMPCCPGLGFGGTPSLSRIPFPSASSGNTHVQRTKHSLNPMRLATATKDWFSVCAIHCTHRKPNPRRPGSALGSPRQWFRRRPTVLSVTYERLNSGNSTSHAISVRRLPEDALISATTPANASPQALSMKTKRINVG